MGNRSQHRILAFLGSAAIVATAGCRHAEMRKSAPVAPPVAANPIAQMETRNPPPSASPGLTSPAPSPSPSPTPVVAGLNLDTVTKAKTVFEPLAQNDEKKAKLAYGRASRHLPELVQFAIDLRFQNYEHAMSLVDKTSMSETQKAFWKAIIEKKPKKLSRAVCDNITSSKEYPPEEAHLNSEDVAWTDVFNDVVRKLATDKETETTAGNTSFDEKLSGFKCDEKESKPASGYCGPLTEDQQKDLMADSFFDKLHNAKRKDTRFVRANYKDAVKLIDYRRNAAVKDLKDLLLFFRSLNATTDNPKQAHYLRRFKGIGRDMKSESLLNRALGDLFTDDKKDQEFTYVLLRFKDENQLVSEVSRLDYELAAGCQPKQ